MLRVERRGPIVVVGSVNMDLVCRVGQLPAPGQTILGSDLATVPGGKGANQAVAAAKLGAEVHLIGRVGEDDFGARLLNGLQQHGVRTDHVTITEGVSSGCALILVDRVGENSIVVSPGANHRLTRSDIDAASTLIERASVVLMQLEVPQEVVEHVLYICRQHHVFTILDPAPAPPTGLPRTLFNVDVLTPNQTEAEALLPDVEMGRMKRSKRVDVKQMATDLLALGPRAVIMKMGTRGATLISHSDGLAIQQIAGVKAEIVDTTAAGDAFNAALAVGLSEGMDIRQAAEMAGVAGALTCETFGAQPSLPTREAIQLRMTGPA